MSRRFATNRWAFTVLELLTVISIITVLACLIYPVSRRILEASRTTGCISHLRQIGIGLNVYLADHQQIMPNLMAGRARISEEIPVIDNTLHLIVAEPAVFACPADRQLALATGTSYYWNVALNGQSISNLKFFNLASDHAHIPILSDKEAFHPLTENKVNVLYADGHATKDLKFVTEKE